MEHTDTARFKAREIVPRLLAGLRPPSLADFSATGIESLYRDALSDLVDALLGHGLHSESQFDIGPAVERIAESLGGRLPNPREVGEIYEHLRGFRCTPGSAGEWKIVPSAGSKRNEGLFYTPPAIVRYIVERTLDGPACVDPADYLNLTILDPSMGTGVFLVEALEQLSARVPTSACEPSERLRAGPSAVTEFGPDDHAETLHGSDLDLETAVRAHISAHNLYGLDLDPTAVKIARAAIRANVCSGKTSACAEPTNLRVGDALKGEARPAQTSLFREQIDAAHAAAYFGSQTVSGNDGGPVFFHWPLEFPGVMGDSRGGFDVVIGNPPYEVLSVRESGIEERRREQAYFRRMFRTCRGKINTYRLMLERGIDLLRPGGCLGFIVPATLLADTSASLLRTRILDETEVLDTVVIPESARAFPGVTQAFVILVLRKGGRTKTLRPVVRETLDPAESAPAGVEVPRSLLEKTGFRIPILRDELDRQILEKLSEYPPLRGADGIPPAGRVHQGEVNLTVHRKFITSARTGLPLIRGEHVLPFRVEHPSPGGERLDWVLPAFLDSWDTAEAKTLRRTDRSRSRGRPWEEQRIVLGRVSNMATKRRLRAAAVPVGAFLGDMTNYIAGCTVPVHYLIGLLNSRLLNRRLKLTSTNNYLSAAEIEALPIPRLANRQACENLAGAGTAFFNSLTSGNAGSERLDLGSVETFLSTYGPDARKEVVAMMIELVVDEILKQSSARSAASARLPLMESVLEAFVLRAYGLAFLWGCL